MVDDADGSFAAVLVSAAEGAASMRVAGVAMVEEGAIMRAGVDTGAAMEVGVIAMIDLEKSEKRNASSRTSICHRTEGSQGPVLFAFAPGMLRRAPLAGFRRMPQEKCLLDIRFQLPGLGSTECISIFSVRWIPRGLRPTCWTMPDESHPRSSIVPPSESIG